MPGEAIEGPRPTQSRAPRTQTRSAASRPTAADVAALAGTSVATVSLVANGKTKGRVGAETVARVTDAIDSLGYVVDHAASALARGTADIAVLIAPDLANPYYGDVVRGVTEVLGDRLQLLLAVASTGVQPSPAVMARLVGLRPAGLLVDAPSQAFLAALPDGPATVLLDAPGADAPGTDDTGAGGAATPRDAVNYDLAPGVDALVDHLADQGHRVVAYLDSSTGTETLALRRRLVAAAADRRGLRLVDGASSVIEVAAATHAFEAAWPGWDDSGATAVVCATDTQAYGVLAAARTLDVRVPDDLAVAGFDDLPSSQVTAPGLTSVALPGAALGRTAAARLLRALGLDPEGAGAAEHPAADDLTARLVVRPSTLAPRG
ncbi:LacI family DNA-binding transcriptional regulator [Frondihabitans australicus]|uniref:LacI family transcriptional regulator n=1 Tax=Frondihabitans australicus TaxID=386892 RepID=A0A495II52_9MICO|nr:LacI family DNA-binding transcriptional regulator [Frondihabitans australicus]RKR75667.1 LacI family transcriptional regulator [Frondihabitans australicus]